MKTEINKHYVDMNSAIILITKIESGRIYFISDTKKDGLIDITGLYFLENSIYYRNLKKYD